MGDMPHWNKFVESVLAERQQDKPDNKDKDGKEQPFRVPLTSEKGVKNNGKK